MSNSKFDVLKLRLLNQVSPHAGEKTINKDEDHSYALLNLDALTVNGGFFVQIQPVTTMGAPAPKDRMGRVQIEVVKRTIN
jgi:hypothetical protein